MKVKMLDLSREYKIYKKDYLNAIENVFNKGAFILGPIVEEFENDFAEYMNIKHVCGVGNGTDALRIALLACGIGNGDEVITTPFTFVATAETIAQTGAKVVFADIDKETLNIDPDEIVKKITPQTKAILPVHLYGNPCDMDKIIDISKEHNLFVIEDCAQSIGSLYKNKQTGSFGKCGCFSFFPTKNLGCAGDGGAIITNDEEINFKIRMLRAHGAAKKYVHRIEGFNSRLDAIHAAMLNFKLKLINNKNERRREIANIYNSIINDKIVRQKTQNGGQHVYHQFTILTEKRDELKEFLKKHDIDSAIHYSIPLHKQEVFSDHKDERYPISEKAVNKVLSLPIYPELKDEETVYVAEKINDFFR